MKSHNFHLYDQTFFLIILESFKAPFETDDKEYKFKEILIMHILSEKSNEIIGEYDALENLITTSYGDKYPNFNLSAVKTCFDTSFEKIYNEYIIREIIK